MRPLVSPAGPGFWASGPLTEWADYLYSLACHTDASLDVIVSTVRAAAPGMLALSERGCPAEVERTKAVHATLVGTDHGGSLYAARFDWCGERFQRAAQATALAAGPGADELPDPLRFALFGSYQDRLHDLRGIREITKPLRATASLFRDVARAAESVGPLNRSGRPGP